METTQVAGPRYKVRITRALEELEPELEAENAAWVEDSTALLQ